MDRIRPEAPSGPGYLSALQYRHRFWTVVFNLSVLTILTLLATASFKIFDTFQIVFGESFVVKPLVGLLAALGVALAITAFGILRPIRRHMTAIESAMTTSSL